MARAKRRIQNPKSDDAAPDVEVAELPAAEHRRRRHRHIAPVTAETAQQRESEPQRRLPPGSRSSPPIRAASCPPASATTDACNCSAAINTGKCKSDSTNNPTRQYLAMLAKAGWRDRTQEEGIWTRQVPKEESWKTVIDAERLFEKIANAIRQDKGLEPIHLERAVA